MCHIFNYKIFIKILLNCTEFPFILYLLLLFNLFIVDYLLIDFIVRKYCDQV